MSNETPSTGLELRLIREKMGLSQDELAAALGFGENGRHIIRAWEHGEKDGKPFAPTPLAFNCLRYLSVLAKIADESSPIEEQMRGTVHIWLRQKARAALPEFMR
jgi:transcriptional regulator with XRE-family HTH domain